MSLAPSRLQYHAHVSLEYQWISGVEARDAKETCALLLQLEGLRKLDICMDEDQNKFKTRSGKLRLGGLESLTGLRGLHEINFHGTCPYIEATLKPKLLEPKPSCEGGRPNGTKKRKREEDQSKPEERRIKRGKAVI